MRCAEVMTRDWGQISCVDSVRQINWQFAQIQYMHTDEDTVTGQSFMVAVQGCGVEP